MSTAIYLRVSSPKDQKANSQRAELDAWLKRQHYQSVPWFEDHESATTMQRTAFQRLQAAILAGEIMTVVVWKLDRLAYSRLLLFRLERGDIQAARRPGGLAWH